MKPRTLVINADDLAMCGAVDAGILELARGGRVTAVSLLVNPPFTADLRPYRDLGVSLCLHLNLTLGAPVRPARSIRSLVEPDGIFKTDPERLLGRLVPAEAAAELAAQLARFREVTGGNPAQLNFHKHLHARDPRLFDLLLDMAAAEGVPARALDEEMRRRCRERGVATADRFLGDVAQGGFWTVERLTDLLAGVGEGVTELMCHPGFPMEPREGVWYGPERDVERQTFLSEEAGRLLRPFRLAGFSPDLWEPG